CWDSARRPSRRPTARRTTSPRRCAPRRSTPYTTRSVSTRATSRSSPSSGNGELGGGTPRELADIVRAGVHQPDGARDRAIRARWIRRGAVRLDTALDMNGPRRLWSQSYEILDGTLRHPLSPAIDGDRIYVAFFGIS